MMFSKLIFLPFFSKINEKPIVKRIAAPIIGHGVIASIPSSLSQTIAKKASDINTTKLFLWISPLINQAPHNAVNTIWPKFIFLITPNSFNIHKIAVAIIKTPTIIFSDFFFILHSLSLQFYFLTV